MLYLFRTVLHIFQICTYTNESWDFSYTCILQLQLQLLFWLLVQKSLITKADRLALLIIK